jgi:hypothetical protein
MSKERRQTNVNQALASLDIEGLHISDYCRSQLNEYIEGRMTKKMMLHMLDEWYIEEVVKERLEGKTITVDIKDL